MTLNSSGKNTVGILGSGFGLYGYLPAVVFNSNSSVILLEQYKTKYEARPELLEFSKNILWLDKGSLFEQSDTLVVCLSPEGQFSYVKEALAYPNIRWLVMEKPLAVDPKQANELLNLVTASGKHYRIGYNFQYTNWGVNLLKTLNSSIPQHIKITWHFLANHYSKDIHIWKRYSSQGGGIIRFYGIHLIALLALMESNKVLSSVTSSYSSDEMYKWKAQFEINSIHTIDIELNSFASDNKFTVSTEDNEHKISTEILANLNDPFDEYALNRNNQDRRVDVIRRILNSLYIDNQQLYWNKLYEKVNHLWETVENINIFS
jgi:predicted dehydrogenase